MARGCALGSSRLQLWRLVLIRRALFPVRSSVPLRRLRENIQIVERDVAIETFWAMVVVEATCSPTAAFHRHQVPNTIPLLAHATQHTSTCKRPTMHATDFHIDRHVVKIMYRCHLLRSPVDLPELFFLLLGAIVHSNHMLRHDRNLFIVSTLRRA